MARASLPKDAKWANRAVRGAGEKRGRGLRERTAVPAVGLPLKSTAGVKEAERPMEASLADA
eukprot:12793319-Alexandrium_andersonii.AAC.1